MLALVFRRLKDAIYRPGPLLTGSTMLKIFAILCAALLLSHSAAQNPCAVRNIEVMKDFQPEQFYGDWYVTTKSFESPFSNPFSDYKETNMNFRFIPQSDGRILTYISYFMKFAGIGFCNKQKAFLVDVEDDEEPKAKRVFKAQGILSSFGNLGGLTRLWVMDTDYNSYAILYSCTSDVFESECNLDYSHLFLLTKLDHPSEQSNDRLKDWTDKHSCFRAIYTVAEEQDGRCNFVQEGDVFAEISLPGIYLISSVAAVVLIGLITVCCCCCCCNE